MFLGISVLAGACGGGEPARESGDVAGGGSMASGGSMDAEAAGGPGIAAPDDDGVSAGGGNEAPRPPSSKPASSSPELVTTPVSAPGATAPVGVALPDDEARAWVFDESVVHRYELSIDPAVWEALQANARDEQYAEASLAAGGIELARVGLRFKGSLGTLASCFADDGTLRCSKLSMKIKSDEYLADQRFFGLKRLNFNSMLFDDSLMHERLAYRVYREMGLVAPRSAHARLIINGEDWGLFSLVEDVDGRFTESHFDGGDGNLYKEAWPSNADADILARALETNEDIADHSAFLAFQAELLAASPDELPGVLERHVDLDNLLASLAVDRTLVNWDGFTAFYCIEGFCENHNYYWYQDEVAPRFALIPWDLDNSFEPSPLTGVPGAFDVPSDCSMLYDAMGRTLSAPACDPIVRGLALADRARYHEQLDRLLAGPFAKGVIDGWIDALQAQLEPEVATDARGPDLDTFRAGVDRVRSAVDTLRESALSERRGTP